MVKRSLTITMVPSVRTIKADMSYQFDYAYDSAGRLFTLTYPQSQGGVRFKAKMAIPEVS